MKSDGDRIFHRLTDLILHSAEWYETAVFIEQDHEWRITDDEAEYWLELILPSPKGTGILENLAKA
jgi:hypothetical protein